jgi:hypothetical protein
METVEIGGGEIERGKTGMRLLITLLFFLIAGVLRTVLVVLVVFELGWVLITKQPPTERVRGFANRVVSYFYRIGRYVTYNEPEAPFPFSEFPAEVEPGCDEEALLEEGSEAKACCP